MMKLALWTSNRKHLLAGLVYLALTAQQKVPLSLYKFNDICSVKVWMQSGLKVALKKESQVYQLVRSLP